MSMSFSVYEVNSRKGLRGPREIAIAFRSVYFILLLQKIHSFLQQVFRKVRVSNVNVEMKYICKNWLENEHNYMKGLL